jgi:DNA polymerase III sliding clamp (beta) subunit (PCNA family)
MTDKTTASKEALARACALVRPALHSKDYIPALTHIQFAGGRATAYNDVAAISVACRSPVEACVPGELLIRALSGFGGAEVSMQIDKAGAAVLKSGRSTIKLPVLAAGDFPYEAPDANAGEVMTLYREIVAGVEKCLMSVGADPSHPAQMGVTLDAEGGLAVLYSTDNYTVSRFQTKAKLKLPGDAPVILPRFFCEQLIGLARAYPQSTLDLVVYPGGLLVEANEGEASLFTKTPVDVEPLDFPRMFARHVKGDVKEQLAVIPDQLDGALQRALLVLGGEPIKRTRVQARGGQLSLRTSTGMGDSEDDVAFDNDDASFEIDPAHVARGAKACALMGFTDKVTLLADADGAFVHLIAHRAA